MSDWLKIKVGHTYKLNSINCAIFVISAWMPAVYTNKEDFFYQEAGTITVLG